MMDISNTRESQLRHSLVFNHNNGGGSMVMNRSFVGSSLINDSINYADDLRRSRIQNLPSHRKTNLGEQLNFVVIFQTIEIERLSNEIEIQRVKIKEFERQLFNYQNYEVQIRELTQKCFALEREREDYEEEMNKLNKICETLYHDNESLKRKLNEVDSTLQQKYDAERMHSQGLSQELDLFRNKLAASERSRVKEQEQLRAMFENQRKSMIDRQIKEMSVRFQNERNGFENEIRKSKEMLDNRNRQIQNLRQRLQKAEVTIMELKSLENAVQNYQKKIQAFNQEILRVSDLLSAKEQELHNSRMNENRLGQRLKEQGEWEIELRQLRGIIDAKTKENDDWKIRFGKLEDQAIRGRQMSLYNEELGKKLAVAAEELNRLNSLLHSKMEQINMLRKVASDKDAEISRYKNLENDYSTQQTRLNTLKIENQRLQGVLKSRLNEIEDGKRRYADLEGRANVINVIEKQKRMIEEKLNSQVKAVEELQHQLNRARAENDNLRKGDQEAKQIGRENQNLRRQIERLNNVLKQHGQQLDDQKVKSSRLENTVNQLKGTQMHIKNLEAKIGLLTSENGKLNDLIRERKAEIAQLEDNILKMNTQLAQYKNYEIAKNESENAVKRLKEQIQKQQQNIENQEQRLKDAENRAREHESNAYKASQERQRVNGQLRSKAAQFDDLKSRCAKLENQTQKAAQMESTLMEAQNQLYNAAAKNQTANNRIKQLQMEIEKERQFVNEFGCKIIVLSCEIERLSRAEATSGVKSKEYQDLMDNFTKVQTKVNSKSSEIEMCMQKITSLESRITQLTSQYTRLFKQCQSGDQQIRILLKRIDQYQGYAKRIQILAAQMDRLTEERNKLDEDNRSMRMRYANQISAEKREEALNTKLVLMAIEIQCLRGRVQERAKSEDQMRRTILEPVRRL